MGEPAALSPADRDLTLGLCRLIVDGVTNDGDEPWMTVRNFAIREGIPIDTLLLWMAQVVMEAK